MTTGLPTRSAPVRPAPVTPAAALRHLYVAREATSVVLLTVHNLNFFLSLMRGAREAIMAGRYSRFRTRVELARMAEADEDASADVEG